MNAPPELEGTMSLLDEAFRRPEPIDADPDFASRCAAVVTGNARLSPAAQADIYRRQFWLRHIGSLRDDYPALCHLLGEDAFESFCRAYLVAHPPRERLLRDLGAHILDFAQRYTFPERARAAALEMLRYEHAFIDLFDAADPPVLDPATLTQLPEDALERARIVQSPLLRLMRLDYPVHRFRRAVRAGEASPRDLAPSEAPIALALFRKDDIIHYEELDPLAFALLEALGRGEALVPACERVAQELSPEERVALEELIGSWFQQWTAWGWIVDIAL
uniref:Uncharacterized protein n=1 Tax=Racemicystis crocea TaxID=1707966 RepID=A0A3S7V0K7_9BACT|nr:hypothetical protein [Racemicystis crocea]